MTRVYGLLVVALLIASAAAARSTWSPCGLSMLSTLTPMAERGRGRPFLPTALAFLLGSIVGGVALGGGAAVLGAAFSLFSPSETTRWVISALALACGGFVDAQLIGPRLPFHRRQVNDRWLSRYRWWVYGGGFGLQVGVGIATYIMTAGVFVTIVLATLHGNPLVAVAIGAWFGLVRGLAIFVGAGVHQPADLHRLHRWFERERNAARLLTMAVQLLLSTVCAFVAWAFSPLTLLLLSAAVFVGASGWRLRTPDAGSVVNNSRGEQRAGVLSQLPL